MFGIARTTLRRYIINDYLIKFESVIALKIYFRLFEFSININNINDLPFVSEDIKSLSFKEIEELVKPVKKVFKGHLLHHTLEFIFIKWYQLKTLIDITKGLDPQYCDFFTPQEAFLYARQGGVVREHIDEDPEYDYIFNRFIDEYESKYRFKLAPLRFLTSHRDSHEIIGSKDLIEARMRHLYELDKRAFYSVFSKEEYVKIFRNEFKSRKDYIYKYGKRVNIWNEFEGGKVAGMTDDTIEEFVGRWMDFKNEKISEKEWYEKYKYNEFYAKKYLPFIQRVMDYAKGQLEGEPKRVLYEWFLNEYLPNEVFP